MKRSGLAAVVLAILVVGSLVTEAAGRAQGRIGEGKERPLLNTGPPQHCAAAHRVGKIVLTVNNNGTFGDGYSHSNSDCFTGQSLRSCEYPNGSATQYLFAGALWIGAVAGGDTLVSVGNDGWSRPGEFLPDEAPFAVIVKRSILNGDPEAVSEEDYVFAYTDTFRTGVPDDFFGRSHMPLPIEVTQSSYAWSYAYAEDFVLLNYRIKNMGQDRLEDVYVGILIDGDVHAIGRDQGWTDDIAGFVRTAPWTLGSCDLVDSVNIGWIADNDGDLRWGRPVSNVTGLASLGIPLAEPQVNFNWWISNSSPALDFSPRQRGTFEDPLRDFRTGGLGTPEGDVNKYYIMRHREIDYDQVFTGTIPPDDPTWLYPNPDYSATLANGYDTRYLLSFGPLDIDPGQALPMTFAYIGGEDFHTDPNNVNNLPHNPTQYYANVDFSDLTTNARWASWIYDNPGFDSDSDGYSGKFRLCCDSSGTNCDTFWYAGDGVPDFKGASPPPAPKFWLTPRVGALYVRWNGLRSEMARDIFSRRLDFEGYKVYLALDGRPVSFAELASYDRTDYWKYVFNRISGQFELQGAAFALEELRCLYGSGSDPCDDAAFRPEVFTQSRPFIHPSFPDSIFYFAPIGQNPEFGVTTPIRKIYPDAPYPSTFDPGHARPDELTTDGYLKYFEYELTIENLLPEVMYYVNVTTFDYGDPTAGVPMLETSVTEGVQTAYVLLPTRQVHLDIKPGSCPNPLNVKYGKGEVEPELFDDSLNVDEAAPLAAKPFNPSKAIVPVAILGTASFDVSTIDPGTVRLQGVQAVRSSIEDVAAPVADKVVTCGCTTDGPDGYPDLTLKFYRGELINALQPVADGDTVTMNMSAKLLDGSVIEGSDCVIILGHDGLRPLQAASRIIDLDNFPNPFNPTTEVVFTLSSASDVRIEVFNVLGQTVATLADGHFETGSHSVTWQAEGIPSGVYFYRLTTGQQAETRKMLLVR
ncbi:MAG TPA: T9SS type A sorting domain-containing protein [Candidatus Deferrimicrobium sp.]|nr:T9SS type A sorting domain-containing protein [Candidatus Deferrimicrobium sp.]